MTLLIKKRCISIMYKLPSTLSVFCLLGTSSVVFAGNETHTGSQPAMHMEVKDGNRVVCFVHGTKPSDKNTIPVAKNCETGTFTEQLFDSNWKQTIQPNNLTVTISSSSAAECADPAVAGTRITFGDKNCWYQLQNLTIKNWNVCKGYGHEISGCGSLTPGHKYRVKRNSTNPWAAFAEYRFTASGDSDSTECENPEVAGTRITFRGENCWYQLQNLTTENWNVCQGYGHEISGCGSLTPGHRYRVKRNSTDPWQALADFLLPFTGLGYGLRNLNSQFNHHSSKPSDELEFLDPAFTQSIHDDDLPPDLKGDKFSANPDANANFRVLCQWSHFSYDDPILDQTDTSHLHMYFGNTVANAKTNSNKSDPNFIARRGGGTCSGFGLNRSAYWTPALMKGEGQAIVPREIVVYYKTRKVAGSHNVSDVVEMPQGLQLISGNDDKMLTDLNLRMNTHGLTKKSELLFWSCGRSGSVTQEFNRIPTDDEWLRYGCKENDFLNATIYFPQCWAGKHLESANGRDHVEQRKAEEACSEKNKHRLPQLGFLLYWDLKEFDGSTDGLRLSSDKGQSTLDSNPALHAGGTLHGDWIAGWQDATMELWIKQCLRMGRNCTFGQTGTDHKLRHEPTNVYNGHGAEKSYLLDTPHGSSKH